MPEKTSIKEYMDYKNMFTDAEWKTLQFSLFWIFNSVAKADGKIDKKEQEALRRLTKNSSAIINDFAREVVSSIDDDFQKIKSDFDFDKREEIEGMREISDLLNTKLEQKTVVDFKKTLIGIGFYIANASGKWLGSKVCAEEGIAIKLAGMNLRLTASQLEEIPTINDIFSSFDEK